VVVVLAACGSKEKEPGQSLVQVNGQEITVHQVNEELARSNVPAAQKDAATKQLLEALIDRQLLQGEAARDKVDRDPMVVQAIERAKAQIVAQAYLQKRLANTPKPTKDEIETYFNAHPEIFSQRKVFDMNQVIIASKDFNDELKVLLGNAKSLDEVTAWLDGHKIPFARNQMSRSTADLPPELTKKLIGMKKGQMFVIQEGDRNVLVALADIKDNPITAAIAAPQIGQFLMNKKNKEASEAELARLRASAKIVYLNQPKAGEGKDKAAPAPAVPAVPATPAAAAATPAAPAAAGAGAKPVTDDHIKRGVAGL
jgi:EpsD family peptidyl-prolyl cis-trans isomerase